MDLLTLLGSLVGAFAVAELRVRGEIRKLRAESDEAHFSHRQSYYNRLLNAERRRRAVSQERRRTGATEWQKITDEFRDSVNGIIISGTDEAVATAKALDRLYSGSGEMDWDKVDEALREFVQAVRDDLAPRVIPGHPRPWWKLSRGKSKPAT